MVGYAYRKQKLGAYGSREFALASSVSGYLITICLIFRAKINWKSDIGRKYII